MDAYDVLNVSLDATPEDIKKAFRRLSLLHHPDKVQSSPSQNGRGDGLTAEERFNAIQEARKILEDPERRKVYDTFGIDLGEERPEVEVWTIGSATLLIPMRNFVLKTILARLAVWLIGFKWIGRLLMLLGIGTAGLYAADFSMYEVKIKSPEVFPLIANIAIVDAVVILNWIWPLLADTVVLVYLVAEVTGLGLFVENGWKIAGGAAVGCLVVARLIRGWWWWIIGFEVLIAATMLISLVVAAGVMRLWIDQLQMQRTDKVKERRAALRKERQKYLDEIVELKAKLKS